MNGAGDAHGILPFERIRTEAYRLLEGAGLEIGGFENPARPGPRCHVENCDRIAPGEARNLYPELAGRELPRVDWHVDLDAGGLWRFASASRDFIICNHVLEHLLNPVAALSDFLRVVRPGGRLVLTVPDHRYIFDRQCRPTPWRVLRGRFIEGRRIPQAADYRPMAPPLPGESPGDHARRLELHLARREHLNAWTSASFLDFLGRSWRLLGAAPLLEFHAPAERSNLECLTVWRLDSGFSRPAI